MMEERYVPRRFIDSSKNIQEIEVINYETLSSTYLISLFPPLFAQIPSEFTLEILPRLATLEIFDYQPEEMI